MRRRVWQLDAEPFAPVIGTRDPGKSLASVHATVGQQVPELAQQPQCIGACLHGTEAQPAGAVQGLQHAMVDLNCAVRGKQRQRLKLEEGDWVPPLPPLPRAAYMEMLLARWQLFLPLGLTLTQGEERAGGQRSEPDRAIFLAACQHIF